MAYLDHAATTPLRPEAYEAMLPLLREGFGNPSGTHFVARAAKTPLRAEPDLADQVEKLLRARLIAALGLARKAGELTFGYERERKGAVKLGGGRRCNPREVWRNLQALDDQLGVKATSREGWIKLEGEAEAMGRAKHLFLLLEES